MKKNNKIKLFESFVEGYSRMETPNNSEFIAVLNTDKKYSDNAKKYQNKFGKDINKLSEFGKLHGKVWKIIKKTDITEIKNLSDEQKKNGVSGKWIKFIKGSGISALEPNKRWKSKMHYYINWDSNIIKEYNMAGSQYFWSKGIYWSLATESKEKGFLINPDSRLKFSLKDEGPNDVNFKAAIINDKNYILYLLGVLNTKLIFKIKFNFINSSTANQQCDINLIPIIIPNEEDKKFIEDRVKKCIMIQEDIKNTSKKDIEKIEDEIENRVLKIYDLIPK